MGGNGIVQIHTALIGCLGFFKIAAIIKLDSEHGQAVGVIQIGTELKGTERIIAPAHFVQNHAQIQCGYAITFYNTFPVGGENVFRIAMFAEKLSEVFIRLG